jgi:hypothetical protein
MFFFAAPCSKRTETIFSHKPITKKEKTPLVVFSLFFAKGKKFTLFRALLNDRGCFVLCGARLGTLSQDPASF